MKKVKTLLENIWDFGRFMTMVDKIILGVFAAAIALVLALFAPAKRKHGLIALMFGVTAASGAFLIHQFKKHIS